MKTIFYHSNSTRGSSTSTFGLLKRASVCLGSGSKTHCPALIEERGKNLKNSIYFQFEILRPACGMYHTVHTCSETQNNISVQN